MGLIQQSPDLLEEFSTVENVAFPLLFDGMKRSSAWHSRWKRCRV